MTQEDKELLFKDLSARLPYKVMVHIKYNTKEPCYGELTPKDIQWFIDSKIKEIKPYLRPMSSMTEDEKKEFSKLLVKRYCEEDWEGHISTSYCIEIDNVYTDDEDGIKYPSAFSIDAIDWLNAHHFDYRGLIPMGLALEAPEGMYNINEK
jgi:hypothetical protein